MAYTLIFSSSSDPPWFSVWSSAWVVRPFKPSHLLYIRTQLHICQPNKYFFLSVFSLLFSLLFSEIKDISLSILFLFSESLLWSIFPRHSPHWMAHHFNNSPRERLKNSREPPARRNQQKHWWSWHFRSRLVLLQDWWAIFQLSGYVFLLVLEVVGGSNDIS